MARAKKQTLEPVEFPFYSYLLLFLEQNRKSIYASYTPLTKKFLNFNNPENSKAYLRKPQFQALEMYVFLKEFCNNKKYFEIFEDWFYKRDYFEGREEIGVDVITSQTMMFSPLESDKKDDIRKFKLIYDNIKSFQQGYSNYIFALTMGLGKTVLMATSIFYEFLLANKYPKDEKYCHNVLVFAPDKTVLQSLKEIITFDKSKIIPPEYLNWLDSNLRFHFLDETGDSLNAIDNSRFNVIISNNQKIILKKQTAIKPPSQALFDDFSSSYKLKSLNEDYLDLYGFDVETESGLKTNQRFAKLLRLKQLGIYVDEAHHVFGSKLAADFGLTKSSTSLRLTINEIAASLKEAGSHVVACYNYTGTPYASNQLLPEVVYAYGLRDAINNKYLKKVELKKYVSSSIKSLPFIRYSIQYFIDKCNGQRFENMLPKIAFFASDIDELMNELKPSVEKVLSELKIPLSKILVNVGDSTITSDDDLREFKSLDTPESDKQYILLVNKGKEGWNCRSLFGVGLHREPRSKIFVLQATMRCLRQITSLQQTGMVFLSEENVRILEKELDENFRLTIEEFTNAGDKDKPIEVRLVPPPVKVKLTKVSKLHKLKKKEVKPGVDLKLDKLDLDKYKITIEDKVIFDLSKNSGSKKDITSLKDKREYSSLTLVAEISRYLNISPVLINSILNSTKLGITNILTYVNDFNELLYDEIIPRLFKEIFELEEYETKEEIEIELVKEPKDGDCYFVSAKPNLLANLSDEKYIKYKDKSFHLDNYCFDSKPENEMFWNLLQNNDISKVWFTGMLTHGQSDFVINYIDPESHSLRSYYPDFLLLRKDGTYVILEVKGDNMIDDQVVKAKTDYATQMATASGMEYQIIKASEVGLSFMK